ncbi:MAG: hypothetical protein HKN68_19585 [Saprospiraceae bacterium]|nr:hypothetical protein [Saprospiraceae bacterium]
MKFIMKYFNARPAILLLIILITISCGSDTPEITDEDIERPEYAEYELSFAGKQLIGEDVDSQWKPSIGLVWLSTDDKHEGSRDLFGTLTVNIGEGVIMGTEKTRRILSAILSHTNKLRGTPMELNGKTYIHAPEASNNPLDCEKLSIEVANRSFIKVGHICMTMQEIISGEIIKVTGSFTALSK